MESTHAESFNAFIRGGVMIALTVVFCLMFARGVVSTDAFISVYSVALGWWFASRQQQTRSTDRDKRNGGGEPLAPPPTP